MDKRRHTIVIDADFGSTRQCVFYMNALQQLIGAFTASMNSLHKKNHVSAEISWEGIPEIHVHNDEKGRKIHEEAQKNRQEILDLLVKYGDKLPSSRRDVLTLRFQKRHSYEDVARELGVTRERVRQIEADGLEKLRGN